MGRLGIVCCFVLTYSGVAVASEGEDLLLSCSSSSSGSYGADSESSQMMHEEDEVTRLQRVLLQRETDNARLKRDNEQLNFCFASLRTLLIGNEPREGEHRRGNVVQCLFSASQVLKSVGQRIEYEELNEDNNGESNENVLEAAAAEETQEEEYNEGQNFHDLGTCLAKAARRLQETVRDCDASLQRGGCSVRSISQYNSSSSLHSAPVAGIFDGQTARIIEYSITVLNPLFSPNNSDLSNPESPLPEHIHSGRDINIFQGEGDSDNEPLFPADSSGEDV